MLSREDKKRHFLTDETVWRGAFAVAVASGVFSLAVAILLIANYIQITAIAPLDNPELIALRAQLAASPEADETLVSQIRALDLLARKAFFTSQAHLRMGGYLLLGGVIVLLIALRVAARYKPRPPAPEGEAAATAYWGSRSRSRELIALAGVILLIAALASAYFTRLDVPVPERTPSTAPEAAPEATPAATYPDWETMQRNWPSFRGPGGYGVAYYTTAPTDWDGASGKNIKWKTELPLPGANSPVVWDKRIFLSGATEETREIYCFDADTGHLAWKQALGKLPGSPDKPPKGGEETGFAAPTMAAHGDRVFVIFGNGDMGCYDFDGNLKWSKSLGLPDNHYGHSSSLIAFQNLVFVQFDQKANGRLLAFDVADGKEAWTVNRTKLSWSSPACVQTPFGWELVVNSEKNVDAYDPATGALVWQMDCLDGEVAPSPAYGGGMFFVANEYATSTAIRFQPDSKTPVPEIAWQYDEVLPDTASPVATATHFYMATSRGEIVCLDAATGKAAYIQEFDEGFAASPMLVGDRIYALDKAGTTHVFKTGPAFEAIATPQLGEEVLATPAFLDGRIYVRTVKELICIEQGGAGGKSDGSDQ